MKFTTVTEPHVLRLADNLCCKAGIPRPRLWVDENAPVYGAWCISVTRKRSDIYLPRSIIDSTSRLTPVLAHEVGHIAAGHPIMLGIIRAVMLFVVVVLILCCWPLGLVMGLVFYIWLWPYLRRICEYDADHRAAKYIGNADIIIAWLMRFGPGAFSRVKHLEAQRCNNL